MFFTGLQQLLSADSLKNDYETVKHLCQQASHSSIWRAVKFLAIIYWHNSNEGFKNLLKVDFCNEKQLTECEVK